ncbi:MAG: hypothetical protein J6V70_04405 [Kiritimatiellae bacterium]|nr:hypothetical protein [Kiritimatiellia bacterium]
MDTIISAIDDVINHVKNELQAGRRYVAIDKDIVTDFLAASPIVPKAQQVVNTTSGVTASATNVAPAPVAPIAKSGSLYKKYRGTVISPLYAFIGYEPSYDSAPEDKAFSGEQGALLDKMIAAMGLAEHEYIILNIFEESSKNFTAPAIENQVKNLETFLTQVSPSVIILMGDEATRLLLKTNSPVANIHGMRYQIFGKPCIPTYHPKNLLRFISAKKSAWADLKNALAILNRTPPPIRK